jgi:hypothetical protein
VARITFQKRQKEMKRIEKQKMKAERRFNKKLDKGTDNEIPVEEMEVLTGPRLLEPELYE